MQKSPYTFFVIIPHTKIPPFRRSLLVLRFFFYYKNSGFLCQEIDFYYFQGKNMIFFLKLLDKPKNETIMQSVQKKKGSEKSNEQDNIFRVSLCREPSAGARWQVSQRTIPCELYRRNQKWKVVRTGLSPLAEKRFTGKCIKWFRGSCLSDRPKETADN